MRKANGTVWRQFFQRTSWVSRILVFIWIVLSFIWIVNGKISPSDCVTSIILYGILLLIPAFVIELCRNPICKNRREKRKAVWENTSAGKRAQIRKQHKQEKRDMLQREKERKRKLLEYQGIYLDEQQIANLERGIELPTVETPVFLKANETAVYYCSAARVEAKDRVVGRSGSYGGGSVRIAKGLSIHTGGSYSQPIYGTVSTEYSGELVITTHRIVFLCVTKGFEVRLASLATVSHCDDGIIIQSGNRTYAVTVPKPDLILQVMQMLQTNAAISSRSNERTKPTETVSTGNEPQNESCFAQSIPLSTNADPAVSADMSFFEENHLEFRYTLVSEDDTFQLNFEIRNQSGVPWYVEPGSGITVKCNVYDNSENLLAIEEAFIEDKQMARNYVSDYLCFSGLYCKKASAFKLYAYRET